MNKKDNRMICKKISIGPLLLECLEKQKESIKEEGYGVLEVSYNCAGEILAKKIMNHNLV